MIPQEGTGFRLIQKNTGILKEIVLVRVNNDLRFLPGVLVIDQELKFTTGFFYSMDLPHVVAALPALLAFEYHYSTLPDHWIVGS